MKKIYSLALIILLLLPACSQANGAQNPAQTEAIVKAYIAAYENKDPAAYQVVFDKDAIYLDVGSPSSRSTGAMYVRNLSTIIATEFKTGVFDVKLTSYFVSDDGRYATLLGAYTNKGFDENVHTVPIAILLEFQNGKIIKEIDYYDGTRFG